MVVRTIDVPLNASEEGASIRFRMYGAASTAHSSACTSAIQPLALTSTSKDLAEELTVGYCSLELISVRTMPGANGTQRRGAGRLIATHFEIDSTAHLLVL